MKSYLNRNLLQRSFGWKDMDAPKKTHPRCMRNTPNRVQMRAPTRIPLTRASDPFDARISSHARLSSGARKLVRAHLTRLSHMTGACIPKQWKTTTAISSIGQLFPTTFNHEHQMASPTTSYYSGSKTLLRRGQRKSMDT